MSYVYLLFCDNGRRTYIGATNDVDRRLRQHNRELSGGARSTHGKEWTRACYISGFPDWNATLQFEWMWKWKSKNYRGLVGKLTGLCELLQSGKSSSGSMPFVFWPQPLGLHIDLVEKIDLFVSVKTSVTRLTSSYFTMSSVSNTDLSNLAVTVQLLRDEVLALKSKLEEFASAGVSTAAAHRPATKEPKLIKKKPADPTNTVVTTEAPTAAAEAAAAEAPVKVKKPRKTKADIPAAVTETVATDGAAPVKVKKPRKPKTDVPAAETAAAPVEAAPAEAAPAEAAPVKVKKPRKPKAIAEVPTVVEPVSEA